MIQFHNSKLDGAIVVAGGVKVKAPSNKQLSSASHRDKREKCFRRKILRHRNAASSLADAEMRQNG